jgi:hypothetical protein
MHRIIITLLLTASTALAGPVDYHDGGFRDGYGRGAQWHEVRDFNVSGEDEGDAYDDYETGPIAITCEMAIAEYNDAQGDANAALAAHIACLNANDNALSECGDTDNALVDAIADLAYAQGVWDQACS